MLCMYVCMYGLNMSIRLPHRMCDHSLVLWAGAIGDGFQHGEVSVRGLGDLHSFT